MKSMVAGRKNLYAGIMYIAVALWFGLQSFELGIGRINEMGPGFFPLVVSALLVVAGIATIFSSAGGRTVIGKTAWRSLFFLLAAPVLFTVLVEGAGFLPAMGVAVYTATHADRQIARRTALILAGLFTLFAWVVFIRGLGLQIPVLGSWFMK